MKAVSVPPQEAAPKAYTRLGAVVARYTMRVCFKPEFQRIEYWTYRCDTEGCKLTNDGIQFRHILDPLGLIYKRDKHKYNHVKIFDNSKPVGQQLMFYQVGEKIVYHWTQKNLRIG